MACATFPTRMIFSEDVAQHTRGDVERQKEQGFVPRYPGMITAADVDNGVVHACFHHKVMSRIRVAQGAVLARRIGKGARGHRGSTDGSPLNVRVEIVIGGFRLGKEEGVS